MPKIAIMQPYVFPYVGYFQLIRATDVFVFYNDVNFIKKGWINRNKILSNGKDLIFTIPCLEVSQNKKICDIEVGISEKELGKLLVTIEHSYKKAPFFSEVYPLVSKVLTEGGRYIDQLAMRSVQHVCEYLNISTKLIESKDRYGNEVMKREYRLMDICIKENIRDYINPIGGSEIYTKECFKEGGINLQFLKTNPITYRQFNNEFVPWLSIIDVLMFNNKEQVNQYLDQYTLI
jgi:hypothetical protein